jgi:tRNA pseudouridine13 synthase
MLKTKRKDPLEPVSQPLRASIKTLPEDWRVTEIVDGIWSGEGEHVYLYVEKRCVNTSDVVAWLAQLFEVEEVSVGYSGMKDKFAVTRQWFSVHSSQEIDVDTLNARKIANADLAYIWVLEVNRHNKKLRRGMHALNHFTITLRDLDPLAIDYTANISLLEKPFPNYFGPQRFGKNNLDTALSWLKYRRRKKISRKARGWHFSVLRSFLFNKIVLARCNAGNCHAFIDGDADEFDVPSGSLWGRGRNKLGAQALDIETNAVAGDDWVCEALEFAGVDRGLRPLSVLPSNFEYASIDSGSLMIKFALPPGAYATVLLGQLFDIKDNSF